MEVFSGIPLLLALADKGEGTPRSGQEGLARDMSGGAGFRRLWMDRY